MSNRRQWFKDNAATLILILTIIGGYAAIHNSATHQFETLDGKIDHINAVLTDKSEGLAVRTTKLEGAVKALSDTQNDPIKQIVHDLLASAASSLPQDPQTAAKALQVAKSLIAQLKTKQRPADQEYFSETVSFLDQISTKTNKGELRASAFLARVSLAEYHSTLQAPPKVHLQPETRPTDILLFEEPNAPVPSRQTLDFSLVKGDAVSVAPAAQGTVKFKSVNIVNAQMPLDGIKWEDVTFVNSRIVYRGGFTELGNERFVNCTFDAPPTLAGVKIVDYAALNGERLQLPG